MYYVIESLGYGLELSSPWGETRHQAIENMPIACLQGSIEVHLQRSSFIALMAFQLTVPYLLDFKFHAQPEETYWR